MVVNPRGGGYATAKAAMTGLTRAVAIENAKRGITCNAVLPGWIATASQTRHEVVAGKATPIGRSGRPEEVAACILFLASEEASYVTGEVYGITGGRTPI
jgi:3-oxoacyl-[acyl-carrier protein] reductase